MNLSCVRFVQVLILFCHNHHQSQITPSFQPPKDSARTLTISSEPKTVKATWDTITQQDPDPIKYDTESQTLIARRTLFLGTLTLFPLLLSKQAAQAAPPISIIAEELGYFPVTNKAGDTVFVPSKISRSSTPQSIALAKHLQQVGAIMVGAYWCPHCRHQKQLFGREAWSYIQYLEGSPRGFGYDPKVLDKTHTTIEGFPTWIFPKLQRKVLVGEAPLQVLAEITNYSGTFDETLEPMDSSASIGSCR